MNSNFEQIAEAVNFIRQQWPDLHAETGIILGSGLGNAIEGLEVIAELPYSKITHFPLSTTIGHKGSLILAGWKGAQAIILSGRFHYYEGYSMQEVTFPVRVLKALGIENLIITAAAGGLWEHYREGQIILLKDHINLMSVHPLRGVNEDRLGIRFPDMSEAYARNLREFFLQEYQSVTGSALEEGVYVSLQGPSLETPAEYLFLHRIGADLVGMSVVPEVIVAVHAGLKVAGLIVVSNVCYPPEAVKHTTAEMVIESAGRASQKLAHLIRSFLERKA